MKDTATNILKFVLFTAIGLGILYYVYSSQDASFQAQCATDGIAKEDCALWRKILADFRSVNYFYILLTVSAFTISNLSRAFRWNMLIAPLGYRPRIRNSYLAIMLAYLANLAVSRVGEVVRCTLLSRYEKIPVDKLFGTVVVDRLLDVICLLICVGMTLLVQFGTILDFFRHNADISAKLTFIYNPITWVVLGVLGLVGVFALRSRDRFRHFDLYDKVKNTILGFWDGIKAIKDLENWGLFLIHTAIIWLMYYMMTYFCFSAFAPTANLGWAAALTVFVFGSFGIVIPSPGGMGSFHFLVVQALIIYMIKGADAFSFANIQFVAVNSCIIFFGLMAVMLMPFLNKGYVPNESTKV